MSEESTTPVPSNNPPSNPSNSPSSEDVKPVENKEGQSVPYDVFQKKNTALREAEAKLAEVAKQEQERLQAEQLAKGEHEKVISDLKPRAERASVLEKTLKSTVDALIADIPEEKRGLIPSTLPVEDQLEYINTNRSFLLGQEKPKNVGKPSSPSTSGDEINDSTIFTVAQLKDPVFYRKNIDAIRKASKEGRILDS